MKPPHSKHFSPSALFVCLVRNAPLFSPLHHALRIRAAHKFPEVTLVPVCRYVAVYRTQTVSYWRPSAVQRQRAKQVRRQSGREPDISAAGCLCLRYSRWLEPRHSSRCPRHDTFVRPIPNSSGLPNMADHIGNSEGIGSYHNEKTRKRRRTPTMFLGFSRQQYTCILANFALLLKLSHKATSSTRT
jgi:hypothetical protein